MPDTLSRLAALDELDRTLSRLSRHRNELRLAQSETDETDRQVRELEADRAVLNEAVPPHVRRHYERIKSRRGTALAKVVNDSCAECRMVVRTSAREKLRLGNQIVYCEFCGRMLYVPVAPVGNGDASRVD